MKIVKPNPLSLSPIFIEILFGNEIIGIATGFPWEEEETIYLVTNWHVVTGIHPETNQPINKNGTTPDNLRIWIHQKEHIGKCETHDINLYDKQGRPCWLEHKNFGQKVDVALLKFDLPDDLIVFPINNRPLGDFRIEVSHDVFIVGFPRGISGAGRLPIWKRGTIASEPELDMDDLPKILIDGLTREGMSGSPVIAQYIGYYRTNPSEMSGDDWFGQERTFLGIYSGRLPGQDEFEAHLGIVWKKDTIDEIIQSGIRPK